jgi:dephospho-CoA kinase
MPFTVALVGGIGSGKSTAAEMLAALGAEVIDSDALAAELTAAGGRAIGAIRAAFGEAALARDGALDRRRMRDLALGDPRVAGAMERILHLHVLEETTRRMRASRAPYVVLVVPNLAAEGRARLGLDRVVRVECALEARVARVTARSGLPEAKIRSMMGASVRRPGPADESLDNSGSLDDLRARVTALHARCLEAAVAKQVTSGERT